MKSRIVFTLVAFAVTLITLTSAARADWQTVPIQGGAVTSFTMDDTYLYAATDTGGVFRSGDLGATWVAANTGLPDKSIAAIQANNGRVFVALKNGFGGAIFYSTDHGDSWTAPTTPYFGYVFCLAPMGNATLAGTWYGVAKSTNNGNSWPTMNDSGLPSNAGVTALLVNGNTIYAGVSASSVDGTGIFMTTNNGSVWTPKNTGLGSTIISALASATFAAPVGTVLFAGTSAGLYTSTDNGAHWVAASGSLADASVYSISAKGSTVIASTSVGVFSYDPGLTDWTNIVGNIPSGTTITSAVILGDQILIAGNNSIWKRPLGEVAGVASTELAEEIRVWPNPTTETVTIDLRTAQEILSIRMTDLTGRAISLPTERVSASELTLNCHGLASGIYFLRVQTAEGSRAVKIGVE